jgi:putative phosphonate metabolism protein
MFTRYAIYYTPEDGTPLAEFGANWLGWDSARGVARAHPDCADLDVGAITATPRKYGFHGTIKPPFRLATGHSADDLAEALARLCADAGPVTLDGLHLSGLGRFLALVPVGDAAPLAQLAARAVQELDSLRAPPTEAELAKRRGARLSAAQDANLVRWGYPYVLDQFRFHMTLTGPLNTDIAALAEAALRAPVAALPLVPYHMTGLTLLGEDGQGMFHQIHRYALTG